MLEIRELHVHYGKIQALYGVSLQVKAKEAVAVIGANGAGKSTLINTTIGWQPASAGSIRYDNEEITQLSPWERAARGIALSPERGRLFPDMTVENNLRLGAYLQPDKVVVEQMEWVFEYFPRLAERRRQQAKTLSGGEQQMLSLGRALMSRPRLVLIDEASMGLAPVLVERVFDVIRQLRALEVSILLVEQHAYGALEVVDRAYVLENGAITLEGTPDELQEDERVKAAYLGG